jgi:hypothetical protein
MLHTYNDGSVLRLMTSRELVAIPVWKGQRILDREHAADIKNAVGSNVNILDSGYSIVRYKEENTDGTIIMSSYLIDGQHRASVIRDFYSSTVCEPDFNVTVTEKTVDSESDAIMYFNKINNVKAQQWKLDPNLLINNYLRALESHFNKNKKCLLIRPESTARPYLSANSLREVFSKNISYIKSNNDEIMRFIERVDKYNTHMCTNFEVELAHNQCKDENIKKRAVAAKFALAYDTKLKWLRELLVLNPQ